MVNDALLVLFSQFEEVKKIAEYDALNLEFNRIIAKTEKTEVSEDNISKLYEIIKINWRRGISDKCQELKDKIEKRKSKGESFSKILSKIDKLRNQSEKELDMAEYFDILSELRELNRDVDDKISIEKHQKQQRWKQLIIGIVASGVLGFLLGKSLG